MRCVVLCAAMAAEGPTAGHAAQGSARQAVTANFQVTSRHVKQDARQIAQLCEQWREKLFATWRPQDSAIPWKLPCQLVIHDSRQSYVAQWGAVVNRVSVTRKRLTSRSGVMPGSARSSRNTAATRWPTCRNGRHQAEHDKRDTESADDMHLAR
jgi:hypothetical protein